MATREEMLNAILAKQAPEIVAPEIDETKLVGVVVNELLPVVNIDCEEEIQSNFEYRKVVGGVAITSYLGNLESFSIPQYFKVDNEEHLVVQIIVGLG